MNDTLQHIFDGIVSGKRADVLDGIQTGLAANIPVDQMINNAMIPAMGEVGKRFEKGDYFIPEMLASARAMQLGMNTVKPYLATVNIKAAGTVVFGTVNGDLHDIGKNLVSVMLEGAGFTVIDLGTDISPDRFVQAVEEHQPDILALSALLTTTMTNLRVVIDALKQAGLRDKVKVLVGGAPVTADFAQEIGADGYAPDASRAVNAAKTLVG
ncbi:MAG: corrinoid protein [Anaerolineae bacterium]|nr:corrinoid protein [Anaerolineae bacterium]